MSDMQVYLHTFRACEGTWSDSWGSLRVYVPYCRICTMLLYALLPASSAYAKPEWAACYSA